MYEKPYTKSERVRGERCGRDILSLSLSLSLVSITLFELFSKGDS